MSNQFKLFGEILVTDFGIDREDIDKALKFQQEYKGKLGEILLHSGLITEEQITAVLSRQFGMPQVKEVVKDFSEVIFEPLMDIQPVWYMTNEIIPLFAREQEHKMYFALRDPMNLYGMEVVSGTYTGYTAVFLLADDRQYREITGLFNIKYLKPDESEYNRNEVEKLKDLAAEAPIIKFVNSMISRAADYRSSDIHLESHSDYLKIRYRIDGVLKDIDRVLAGTASAVLSRIKIMADMDIGEKRLPQDGRIQVKVAGKLFDIRVSTLPTIYGENIVMRLLEKENIDYNIDTLGLIGDDIKKINRLIAHNFGLILVTGPTGSGKSTTLYSVLNGLNREERKIITVEDPVEYQIEGISQIQVQEQIGLSFANILRNILRQDPDIVMIGEIRDKETAEIAIRASLTGHLVLATLHTNDALSAVTRLIDMGVDDYLVNASLLGVVAQRLVRKICPYCAEPITVAQTIMDELELKTIQARHHLKTLSLKKGRGCEQCAGTGYKGRVGVFEILEFSDDLKNALSKYKEYDRLRPVLMEKGFKSLREDAVLKWAGGVTTAEEIFRVT
ncbi:MAG: Flp pilus assembly complex ATPase component TadA [Acidobacteria bacterium]|jgi:type II secretory ATPase GspE/PulE/Tfp pilus assembly ATPase PilB-like protein|nr:Flp pilus assembly complex ATPase component TadA [Acidobacteriota bacterium]